MSAIPSARPQSRRTFLTAGSAAILGGATAGAVASATAATVPDPIFALIEAERAAWQRLEDASGYEDDIPKSDPCFAAAEAEWCSADEAQIKAQAAVFAAVPTTAAGLLAMVELYADRSRNWIGDPWEDDLHNLFAGIRQFIGGRA